MKTGIRPGRLTFLAALLLLASGAVAQQDPEQQLIQVLTSNAAPAEKGAACQKLKTLGTTRCVPALATLLLDELLSHSARYVLESMACPEAGTALLSALHGTSGQAQLGIICSLGQRGEAAAVPELAKLARGPNMSTAIASAHALGRIDSPNTLKLLQRLADESSGPLHDAAVGGLLQCADRLVSAGGASKASSIFENIYNSDKADGIRLAAYRGMIRAAGPKGLNLIVGAITGPAGPAQLASLQMVREMKAPKTTAALASLLPRLGVPVQVALVEALAQRDDSAAVPALVNLAASVGPEVRVPVFRALGSLGNASVVSVLAQPAASGTPPEQAAARQALIDLRRGNVAEAMVTQLASSSSGVQSELARALGDRGERAALPHLMELAQQGPISTRRAALKAVGMLAEEPQLTPLVQLVLDAAEPEVRAQAAEALNSAAHRILLRRGTVDLKPLVKGAASGPKEGRIAVLSICGGLTSPDVRVCLRSALQDPDPQVAAAAARALCDTADPDLVEDVLSFARTAQDGALRSFAIAGGVRLLTQEEAVKLSWSQRVAGLQTLISVAARPEEKRMVIAGLGEMPGMDALRAVEPFLKNAALRSEAARATTKIALTLPEPQVRQGIDVLRKALASGTDASTREAVQAALNQLQETAAYLTAWVAAGPFRQSGKDFAALFDIAFPPESGDSKDLDWRPLPPGTDPKRPYVMDLLKLLGGEQCVAYVRTSVHCDRETAALLVLGSDDGVKIWLNDKQVYALNTARPLQPGSDKVNLNLQAGWNSLLMKITQNNLGWEFTSRLVKLDGSPLDGVQIQAVR